MKLHLQMKVNLHQSRKKSKGQALQTSIEIVKGETNKEKTLLFKTNDAEKQNNAQIITKVLIFILILYPL